MVASACTRTRLLRPCKATPRLQAILARRKSMRKRSSTGASSPRLVVTRRRLYASFVRTACDHIPQAIRRDGSRCGSARLRARPQSIWCDSLKGS